MTFDLITGFYMVIWSSLTIMAWLSGSQERIDELLAEAEAKLRQDNAHLAARLQEKKR